jgi:hypothetical protein
MIEQYFKPGVRFLWNKPNDAIVPMDGAFVPSPGGANNLVYDGIDGHQAIVDPVLQIIDVSVVLGLAMKQAGPHSWLCYAPGRTAHRPMGGGDILTGYMSGCPIARGTYNGVMSAFHVGTITGNRPVNQSVKETFALALPANITAFNPAGAWLPGEIAAKQLALGGPPATTAAPFIFALITAAGAFYSILMFNIDDNGLWNNTAGQRYWCVGGIKLVPPVTGKVRVIAMMMS